MLQKYVYDFIRKSVDPNKSRRLFCRHSVLQIKLYRKNIYLNPPARFFGCFAVLLYQCINKIGTCHQLQPKKVSLSLYVAPALVHTVSSCVESPTTYRGNPGYQSSDHELPPLNSSLPKSSSLRRVRHCGAPLQACRGL